MMTAKLKLAAILAGGIALSACGGGTETESFSVSLDGVEVVDKSGNPVSVNVVGITQNGKLETE